MAALRDSAPQIAAYDVDVLYVSLDSPEKNAEFAASLDTQIPVLSDPKGATARRYGVLKLGGLYASRWTFYIGPDGRLLEIDKHVRPATAGEDMLQTLERFGFERSSSVEEAADSR